MGALLKYTDMNFHYLSNVIFIMQNNFFKNILTLKLILAAIKDFLISMQFQHLHYCY